MPDVTTNVARARVRALLQQVPAILAGTAPDPTGGEVKQLLTAVGMQALSIVKSAFVVKSRGGTDEAGIKWKPLDPKTIAYGRRHPGLSRNQGKRPLLTSRLDALWRGIYASQLARGLKAGMDRGAAAGQAAQLAWAIVKKQGGRTILGEYGHTSVEIGRDTDQLFNSLSPNGPENLLEAQPGACRVGTNVKHGAPFHKRRPLWPAEDAWPAVWTDRMAETLGDGLHLLARHLLSQWGSAF